MKVATWNCSMAFRKKAGFILQHKPDILIVQECEHPDKLIFGPGIPKPNDILWFGTNLNKGLGIFSYGDHRFQLLDTHNPELRIIVPIAVSGGMYDFTLYAIWANNPDDPDGRYIEQVWKALHHYDQQLNSKRTMVIGDFNSNTMWDWKHRRGNHSKVVKALADKEIYSCYHLHHKQIQGKEEHPTLYLHRHRDKPYHIDYCFVSSDMANNIESVHIGDYDPWIQFSDHAPVITTFQFADQ
jgi:exodeoxyribonuclease-3